MAYVGDADHLPVRSELSIARPQTSLGLQFATPSLELSLDQPSHELTVHIDSATAPSGLPRPALRAWLEDGTERFDLAATGWRRSGHAVRFHLPSTALRGAGPARLIVEYPGSEEHAPESAGALALRVANVRLEASLHASGTEPRLRVTANSVVGPVPSGQVRVEFDPGSSHTSAVVGGTADVPWPGERTAQPTRVLIHYESAHTWWAAPEPLELDGENLRPRPPERWPWLVLLIPIGIVSMRALERPRGPTRRAARETSQRPLPRAPVRGAEETASPIQGYGGRVVDAHTGAPVAGARVHIRSSSWLEQPPACETATDSEGHYLLAETNDPGAEGLQLVVTAKLHREVRQPLPPPGRVDVALVSRSRALLRELVDFARDRGPPWHRAGAEPTPGQVADVAARRGERGAADWALGVEAAAFDPGEVDSERESQIAARKPR